MDDIVETLIETFAPTIASKFKEIIAGRRIKGKDLNTLLVALVVEQNAQVSNALVQMNKNLTKVTSTMTTVLKELKSLNEGMTILLKRTE